MLNEPASLFDTHTHRDSDSDTRPRHSHQIPRCPKNFSCRIAYTNSGQAISIARYLDMKKAGHAPTVYCSPRNAETGAHELVGVDHPHTPHFRHKNPGDATGREMSEWHRSMQNDHEWKDKEHLCPIKDRQIKERRIDAVNETNQAIEFQHSNITRREVDDRRHDHGLHGFGPAIWVVDGTQGNVSLRIACSRDGKPLSVMLKLQRKWLYQSFMEEKHYFIHVGDFVYKIDPSAINKKSSTVTVKPGKPLKEFMEILQKDINMWSENTVVKRKIFKRQWCAGSGKTHGLWQMINDDTHYLNHIFVVKTNAATAHIRKELMSQLENKSLPNMEDVHLDGVPYHEFKARNLSEQPAGRKTRINFTRNGERCKVIVCTIDSYLWRMGNPDKRACDTFASLVEKIGKAEYKDNAITSSGGIRFGPDQFNIDPTTRLVIDEAQDLPKPYLKCLLSLMDDFGCDLVACGDSYQKIYHTTCMFDSIDKCLADKYDVKITSNDTCRRMKNRALMEVRNKIIDDEKYGGKPISNIHPDHSDRDARYDCIKIEQTPDYWYTDKNGKRHRDTLLTNNYVIIRTIEYIDSVVNAENDINKCVPESFEFIFGYISNNALAKDLEDELTIYWRNKFRNKEYQDRVLKNHPYWSKHYETTSSENYVELHHSEEERQTIELTTSEHKTRLVSIHSSKGDGRWCVIAFNINEAVLKIYTNGEMNQTYESLLNVAWTRAEMRFMFWLDPIYDDITKRVKRVAEDNQLVIGESISHIKDNINSKTLVNGILCDNMRYTALSESLNLPQYEEEPCAHDTDHDTNQVTDWCHHVWKNSIIHVKTVAMILSNLDPYSGLDEDWTSNQLKVVLDKIQQASIVEVQSPRDCRDVIWRKHGSSDNLKQIPIPRQTFGDDFDAIKQAIEYVLQRVRKFINDSARRSLDDDHGDGDEGFKTFHYLVLEYLMEVIQKRQYASMNSVALLRHYRKIKDNDAHHDAHYSEIENIGKSIEALWNKLKSDYPDEKFIWNLYHKVDYGGDTKSFHMYDQFSLIAYSTERVIPIIIKPETNSLNFPKIMTQVLCNDFILRNVSNDTKKNHGKYSGKEIMSALITCDPKDTQLYCISTVNHEFEVKQFLKNVIYNSYSANSISIYTYFAIWKNDILSGARSVQDFDKDLRSYCGTPSYIVDTISTYISQLDVMTNEGLDERIRSMVREGIGYVNQDKFIDDLEVRLDRDISQFLGI